MYAQVVYVLATGPLHVLQNGQVHEYLNIIRERGRYKVLLQNINKEGQELLIVNF